MSVYYSHNNFQNMILDKNNISRQFRPAIQDSIESLEGDPVRVNVLDLEATLKSFNLDDENTKYLRGQWFNLNQGSIDNGTLIFEENLELKDFYEVNRNTLIQNVMGAKERNMLQKEFNKIKNEQFDSLPALTDLCKTLGIETSENDTFYTLNEKIKNSLASKNADSAIYANDLKLANEQYTELTGEVLPSYFGLDVVQNLIKDTLEPTGDDELLALKAEYKSLYGKNAHYKYGIDKLKELIAEKQ